MAGKAPHAGCIVCFFVSFSGVQPPDSGYRWVKVQFNHIGAAFKGHVRGEVRRNPSKTIEPVFDVLYSEKGTVDVDFFRPRLCLQVTTRTDEHSQALKVLVRRLLTETICGIVSTLTCIASTAICYVLLLLGEPTRTHTHIHTVYGRLTALTQAVKHAIWPLGWRR